MERLLNEYLFHEFGVRGDPERICATWPFQLRKVGEINGRPVFEFDDDEIYFAVDIDGLNFFPKAGMEVDDLRREYAGGCWIGARGPVDLDMSRPGDAAIPSLLERAKALHRMADEALPGGTAQLLAGLFLASEQRYLALVGATAESDAVVVGLPCSVTVGFATASPSRRLAWGVGRWLEECREHGG